MKSLLLLFTSILFSQNLGVVSELDSTKGYIGDIIYWTIMIENYDQQIILFPDIIENNDTLSVQNKNLIDKDGKLVGAKFELVCWDTGEFVTPDYSVQILNKDSTLDFILRAEPRSFIISSVLDDIQDKNFRPLKSPVSVKNIIPIRTILLSISLLFLVLGIVWVWKKRKKKQYQKINYSLIESPGERALRRLNALDSSGLLKDFYANLSHISRELIETKYYIRALEMSTEEINFHRKLFPVDDSRFIDWIQFLNEADLVKYAKETPSSEKILLDKERVNILIQQL